MGPDEENKQEPVEVKATIEGLKRMLDEGQVKEGMTISVITREPLTHEAGEGCAPAQ